MVRERQTEVAVVGGGLGGIAAALAALRLGRRVILSEESPWLGGQLTTQIVPPDEHPWVEAIGRTRSYADLRERIRAYYQRGYPLIPDARADVRLNPGQGAVSALCHEPRVALAVIEEMLAPFASGGQLVVLTDHAPISVDADGDRVTAVTLRDKRGGGEIIVTAPYFIDATELGDLIELGGVEHVIGAESREDTGELHAVEGVAAPLDQQAISWCFALDYRPGEDHTIDRPAAYDTWCEYQPDFWPAPLFSWTDVVPMTLEERTEPIFAAPDSPRGGVHQDRWNYRRILSVAHYQPGTFASDITVVNWPQIDYWGGPLLGVPAADRDRHLAQSREQALSFLYWMQTAAPALGGATGYPGLRLRPDVTGTSDGLAMRPYIRESRRILAETRVVEAHVGVKARTLAGLPDGAERYHDSVGLGSYRIDLHPSTGADGKPRTYVDVSSYPFEIPFGALIPQRVDNLLAGGKNIGTTHITNGCYRLHPVEWNIGEAAGAAAAFALDHGVDPRGIRADLGLLHDYQLVLTAKLGVGLHWPVWARTIRN
ncbi:FAD-dependent oxidoreductase [Dactylosporangium sp. CA-233914]|uniref:FAD-dependent oxidoreductase n=1 Tax=Dactylosporangium sp. CA-233914 TaxID=3239934 RepID=UPI003D8DF544